MKAHRITQLIVTGVAAAAVAAPAGLAATNDRVQLAGSFVAPERLSEAQLDAGHAASTRMVQIGGKLVAPAQLSAWENGAGGTASTGTDDSSSGIGTGSIAAFAVLGSVAMLAAASALIFRHRRRLTMASA